MFTESEATQGIASSVANSWRISLSWWRRHSRTGDEDGDVAAGAGEAPSIVTASATASGLMGGSARGGEVGFGEGGADARHRTALGPREHQRAAAANHVRDADAAAAGQRRHRRHRARRAVGG